MKTKTTKLKAGSKSRMDIFKENKLKGKSSIHSGSFKFTGRPKWLKSKWVKKARKIALIFFGVFIIVLFVAGLRVMAELQTLNDQLPTPDQVFRERPIASEIYDRKAIEDPANGTRLFRLFNEYNSDPVNIEQIPETVKWAFLAAEDSDFYIHKGFDPAALIRCGIVYLKRDGNVCGGSTITQQLVKAVVGSETTLDRKLKEILLAVKVEQAYKKDQILEMYLRIAPFGSNIYGVKTAANFYFGKEPKDLTLSEAALLAAVVQDPVRLSPTLSQDKTEVYCRLSDGLIIDENNVQSLEGNQYQTFGGETVYKTFKYKCRQLYILGQMTQKMSMINNQTRTNLDNPEMDDVLTEELVDDARKAELTFRPPVFDIKAGHFVDYTLQQLKTRNYKNGTEPFTTEELQKGGYKIYTSLDYGIQKVAEEAVLKAGNSYKHWNMNNAAVMTVTPSNGQIISMAGSKDYYAKESEGCNDLKQRCKFDPIVNIMTTLQSPGSTNKVAGYYQAFKEGKIFTKSILPDVPIKISDASGTYELKNWNGGFNGINTAEQMIRDSRNLPALQIIQMISVDTYLNNAREFGYTSYTGQYGASVILGGADIYPIEHVQAFTMYANNGDIVKLNPILKILDKDGNTIYSAEPERKSIGDQQAVFLINQSLKNLDGFSWDQRELAAKTGTSEESKDAMMMVWSPDFVTFGWGGNNNNDPMDRNNGYPPLVIKPWLQTYMKDIGDASYFSARTPFTRPGYVYEGGGDCNDKGECLGMARGWLINDRTPPRDIVHKKVKVCVDQKDRLARDIDIAMGMSEEKEFTYYRNPVPEWQKFLDEWLKGKNREKPNDWPLNGGPTESCNIDRSGGTVGPFFQFGGVTATATSINIRGGIFSTSGSITSANFYIDNKVIPACTAPNYSSFDITCDITTLDLDSGTFAFKATATDASGLTNTSANRDVIVGSDTTTNLTFTNMPPATLIYGVSAGPGKNYNVDVKYAPAATLNNVQIYQVKTEGTNAPVTTLLGTMTAQGSNVYRFSFGSTVTNTTATYKFFVTANITGSTGRIKSVQSSSVAVTGV